MFQCIKAKSVKDGKLAKKLHTNFLFPIFFAKYTVFVVFTKYVI